MMMVWDKPIVTFSRQSIECMQTDENIYVSIPAIVVSLVFWVCFGILEEEEEKAIMSKHETTDIPKLSNEYMNQQHNVQSKLAVMPKMRCYEELLRNKECVQKQKQNTACENQVAQQ